MSYQWDFSVFQSYTSAFFRGMGVTIMLSIISSIAGTVFGILLGLILRFRKISWILLPINDILRAIPMLVLMFFFYYFPYKEVFGIKPLSAFTAATLALTLAQMVFTADLVRAAVDGVSHNSILGAKALGLHQLDILRFIILAFYIGNIKLSSLASAIGCHETVFVARVAISQTYRSLEAWCIVGLVYVILVVPLGLLARRLEKSEWLIRR